MIALIETLELIGTTCLFAAALSLSVAIIVPGIATACRVIRDGRAR